MCRHHFKSVHDDVVFVFRIESWNAKSRLPCDKAVLKKKSHFLDPGSIFAVSMCILTPETVYHPRLELLREVDCKKQHDWTRSVRKIGFFLS